MARRELGVLLQHIHQRVGGPTGDDLTDSLLVERFLAGGEEAAFELLVRRHGALVLRVCRRVLDDAHAAEDAFQATFLILVRKAASIRRQDSLSSWLYGVAYRVARKARVRVTKHRTRERPLTDLAGDLPDGSLPGELRHVLDEELVRLSEKYRAPLVLCYLQGKTYEQAARELGWSEGSMSRRLAQAREELRQRLVRRGVTLGLGGLGAALAAEANAAVPAALIDATVHAAAGSVATGTSGAAAMLANGVIRDMFLIKLKLTASLCLAVGAVTVGLALTTPDGKYTPSAAVDDPDGPLWFAGAASAVYSIPDQPEIEANSNEMQPEEEEDEVPEMPEASRPDQVELQRLFEQQPPPPKVVIKRRDLSSEEDLRRQLLKVPELNLDADASRPTTELITRRARKPEPNQGRHFIPDLLASRTDLAGLPLRQDAACELDQPTATDLQARSRDLRRLVAEIIEGTSNPLSQASTLRINFIRGRDFKEQFLEVGAVPTLVQILSAEAAPFRRVLVEQLAKNKHPATTTALARLAMFDLSPEVRADAVAALTERPADEYRATLLEGFRYPWAPVADHAAEAVVALEDRGMLAALKQLVDQPDPSVPVPGPQKGTQVVAELVRVNHLRNCLMCHAPSIEREGRVLAPVPTPGKPLPPPFAYYVPQGDQIVRADITYLRQDFSTAQPVDQAAPWPEHQRYDYLVRQRPVTSVASKASQATTYPQREAVLYAVQELQGR